MSAADKPDVGSLLKNRREECGLSVQELAIRTRISRNYLQALEENRFNIFPGEAYLTGFLRVYARALGLRPASLLATYEEQVAGTGKPEEIPPDPPPRIRRQRKRGGPLPWLAIGLLTAAALTLVSLKPKISEKTAPAALDLIATAAKPADAAPAQEIPAAVPAPATAAATTGRPAASRVTDLAAAKTAEAKGVSNAAAAPLAAVPAATTIPERKEAPSLAAAADRPATDKEPLTLNFPGNSRLRLVALGPSQVEFSADNRPPQSYDLAASAALSWKVRQTASIRLTDPAAVRLWINERSLALGGHRELVLQTEGMPGSTEGR